MNKANELLRECQVLLNEVHAGNIITEEDSKLQYKLQKKIDSYLNYQDKLVAGSEWVCNSSCAAEDYDNAQLRTIDRGETVIVESERNDTVIFWVTKINDWGTANKKQFLEWFVPKEIDPNIWTCDW